MNRFERRSIRSFGKIADHYDDTVEGRYTLPFKQQLLAIVAVPAGGRVLDVACGNGRLLEMLARKHDFDGYGVDISDKMIENARRINPAMTFEQAGCGALPFPDAHFDVVTVCAAYHHFPDVSGFAKEAFRTLKPGGSLYIAEVDYPLWARVLINPIFRFSPEGDVRLYGPKEIVRVLEKAGFRLEALRRSGRIQIVAARKR